MNSVSVVEKNGLYKAEGDTFFHVVDVDIENGNVTVRRYV